MQCATPCYACRMMIVAVRELRNNTSAVIDRVKGGDTVYLTSQGQRIARIEPIDAYLKPYLTRDDLMTIPKADPQLRVDLAALGSFDTDTVGQLR